MPNVWRACMTLPSGVSRGVGEREQRRLKFETDATERTLRDAAIRFALVTLNYTRYAPRRV